MASFQGSKDYFDQHGGKLLDPGNIFDSHGHVDLSPLTHAMDNAFGVEKQLGDERAGYAGLFNPANDAMLGAQEQGNITGLRDIASGRATSPVELQLQQQAARNSAGAYGTAAALQGRNPGSALRQALDSSFRTNSDANLQAAQVRAQQQQAAQTALIQALASARGQGQNLLSADMDWRKALLNGQLSALDSSSKAAQAYGTAQGGQVAADNAKSGGLVSGIVGGIL